MNQQGASKQSAEFLSEETRYHSLFEGVPMGLYITAQDGRIIDANPALVQMLGYPSKSSLLGTRASEIYRNPSDRERERDLFEDDLVVQNYETQLHRLDGTPIWVRDTCRAIRNESGAIQFFEGILQDITQEKAAEQQLIHMARHDPLTGVLNRHALTEVLKRETSRSQRFKHPIGILMTDINRFKEVNDRFGHPTGDHVLSLVATALSSSIRDTDYVIRYGGDEFLLLLIETQGETQQVQTRIHNEIRSLQSAELPCEFAITLSIGAAQWIPSSNVPIETALAEADQSMYTEKRRRTSYQSFAFSQRSRSCPSIRLR